MRKDVQVDHDLEPPGMPLSQGATIGGFYFLAGVVGTVASFVGGRTAVPLRIIALLLGLAEIWTPLFTRTSCFWWARPNDCHDVLNQTLTVVTVLVYGTRRTRPRLGLRLQDGTAWRDARCRRQVRGGMPTISRNSSVEFVTGNGSVGTGNPSRSQIGSQPSSKFHSSRRLAGTSARTASLWRI